MRDNANSGVRICAMPNVACFDKDTPYLIRGIIPTGSTFMTVPVRTHNNEVDTKWLRVVDQDNPSEFLGYVWHGKSIEYVGEYDERYYGDF